VTVAGPYTFALCDPERLFRPGDLWAMAQALELNAAHCADAWGLARPAVKLIDDASYLPTFANCHPVVLVGEGQPSKPGALAHHGWDWVRNVTTSRVYVHRSSGLRTGRYSVCEAAAHEVTEALVDPLVNQWRRHPQEPGVEVALEIADPVQDTYDVEVEWRGRNSTWPVANFVLPAWFDATASGPYDHKGTLKEPGQLGPEGYAILRDRNGRTFPVWGARGIPGAERSAALQHPAARTRRRGVLVEGLSDP
jgi:hypothetical protein